MLLLRLWQQIKEDLLYSNHWIENCDFEHFRYLFPLLFIRVVFDFVLITYFEIIMSLNISLSSGGF